MFRLSMRRRALPAASAVALAAIAAVLPAPAARASGTGPAPVPARYAHQRLNWHPCGDEWPALECATMAAPRDWHRPGTGPDISVEVSRHLATGPAAERRGVLMTAAGGPGGTGLGRPAGIVKDAPRVAAAYDVVSFDQRGAGRSTPAHCQTPAEFEDFYAHDLRDRSPAAIQGVLDRSRAMAENCQRRTGGLLPYLTTEQTVRDMDLYRSLLGAEKISYYGGSYATKVGAYYATVFPQRVRRAVLDSNIDFTAGMDQWVAGQPRSFQRRFEQDFLPWLAKYDSVYHYGRTAAEVRANWEARRRALHDRPLTVGASVIGPNQLDNGTIQAAYKASGFPTLARALAALEHWDTATADERALVPYVFDSYQSKEFAAEFFSVTCNDNEWSHDIGRWVERSARDAREYPLVGPRELAYAATCAYWPKTTAPQVNVTGEGLPPTLMLNSLRDPATYYEGALAAHRGLRGSRLVTVEGGDHGQYMNGNPCVDSLVEKYLFDGDLPAHDTTCPAPPLPGPSEISPRSAATRA
ncbi:alpha/beta hydrolase [Streptomyces sp. NPDC050617]|uniref:alpha/beta hydrolase n=1 Tax=Streptomyces sp. NPDC050617 TaxID=3154628 RepID=UPI00344AA8E1